MKKLLIFVLGLFGIFSSCSTDFEINAPYKETMVIYGLLNTLDSAQFIRISKAYLGEGNALIMAQEPDSINYSDVLDVKMERILNGTVVETFALQRTDTIPKEEGVFAAPYQVYYRTNHPIADDGSQYKLVVNNTSSGVTATSITRIVGDVSQDVPIAPNVDFSSRFYITVRFRPGDNSKVSDMIIRFHYTETDTFGNVSQHFVDWNFPEQSYTNAGSSEVEFKYFRPDFFEVLGNGIPHIPGVIRRIDNLAPGYMPVEFRFIVGSEDLHTYEQLTNPGTGVVQDRPIFTTVENGVGLFTSRLIHSEFRNLTVNTISALDTSVFTRDLNFQ
ncbi:MAG TPA: hypothetical protein PLU53_07635 [Bacteroidia bacterium]|nr:hypothetical protein [Bacteroidia bacterium]